MLDPAIIEQLKTVFEVLENPIELVFNQSTHPKQHELVDMLNELASTSKLITATQAQEQSDYPKFKLIYNNDVQRISFSGIPGGHEFSSLVLAILNSDMKGKLPDQMIINRIKALKGPIHLKTFISLSCENCPEVVQALNLMSILNPDFTHEMIDGEFVPEEISRLKIQGVPSVISSTDELVSSGQISMTDLLQKIEEKFGADESMQEEVELGEYDVIVIGAGPAGASTAIYTARKGLKTAIIADKVGGQLQETKGIENLISIPYTEGPELSHNINKHISEYDINLLEHRRVLSVKNEGAYKKLKLNSKESVKTKSLVIATGAKWRELNVPGEKEYLGRGVAFCPHCDGPYYKGKDIAVIGGGNSGVEAAIDLAGIVNSVTVFEFMPELKADGVLVTKLNSLSNSKVITNAKTSEIIGDGSKVTSLKYQDRKTDDLKEINFDGVFVQIGLLPNSGFIKDLVETNKFGEIIVDEKCRTKTDGIYAAGDVTTVPFKQIIVAMGEGAKAGLSVFEDQMLN